jgi:hypothetical protein
MLLFELGPTRELVDAIEMASFCRPLPVQPLHQLLFADQLVAEVERDLSQVFPFQFPAQHLRLLEPVVRRADAKLIGALSGGHNAVGFDNYAAQEFAVSGKAEVEPVARLREFRLESILITLRDGHVQPPC